MKFLTNPYIYGLEKCLKRFPVKFWSSKVNFKFEKEILPAQLDFFQKNAFSAHCALACKTCNLYSGIFPKHYFYYLRSNLNSVQCSHEKCLHFLDVRV